MTIIDRFKNKELCVHCTTSDEAKLFMKICYRNLIRWKNISFDETRTGFGCYEEKSLYYYNYNHLAVDDITEFPINFRKIINFTEFFKQYKKEKMEERRMYSDGKLNKGIENKLTQDMYRAVEDEKGNIAFNKVNMVNVVFVKFDGNNKVYAFENPSDKRLVEGTKIKVDTNSGEQDVIVVSSVKIQKKYLKQLTYAMCGKYVKLKPIIGVYKMIKEERLIEVQTNG